MLPSIARKGPRSGQFDAGAHTVVADELDDGPGQRLAFLAAVAHADAIKQIAQPHDAQADAAGVERGHAQLRHGRCRRWRSRRCREVGRFFGRALQQLPVDLAVFGHVAAKADRSQAAILVGAEPLLAAGLVASSS